MAFRVLSIRAAQCFGTEPIWQHPYIKVYSIRPFLQLSENKLRQQWMLFIDPLKARIGAQMEDGGGTRVIGMTSSKGCIWSISVWMTQVANASSQLGWRE